LSILARLSSYTSKVGGIATNIVGQMIQTSVTLILGLTMAFVFDWRLSLINLVFMPIIMVTYILQFKVQKNTTENSIELESEASSILGETLSNTKTIYAYNMQGFVVNFYSKIIRKINYQDIYKSGIINGILNSLSQFIIFAMYGTLFYAGGVLVEYDRNYLTRMMTAILTILFSALGVGIAQAFVGDYSAAQKAVVGIFDFLDQNSLIDVDQSIKNGKEIKEFKGKIEFKNVRFSYSNSGKPVFNDLSFVVYPGQSAAFVGPSGSGKSTIISLIERFYDVNEGQILIDDVDIREYNLIYLRKKIGTVLQEPGIFSRPIIENIRYGNLDSNDKEVEICAKRAFIENNLHNLSSLGSGGEMQRVAIARAILKNPAILLLDEATSALDANLEEHIRVSLKELMKDRTSIAIAHRFKYLFL
jgi:ATP-binding cassette subfamily B (MDR/TAP) protein 1